METTINERTDAFNAGYWAWKNTPPGADYPIAYDNRELQLCFDDGWTKAQDDYADLASDLIDMGLAV